MARSTPRISPRAADAAVALTAAVGALLLIARPQVADLAAHFYRAGLWEREGWTVWNAQWYGGHHVPAYSLLYPPLAAILGVRVSGWLAALAATALFARIAGRVTTTPVRGTAAAWTFAAAICANLVIGRMPFVLGVAIGLGAWTLATLRRSKWSAAAALACAAASPVAGVFLALAGVARRDPWLVVPPLALVGALSLLFPEGGVQGFAADTFWPVFLPSLAAIALLRGRVRRAAALNGALLAGAFIIASPVGANAARLGFLLGAPVLALAGPARRATVLVAVAFSVLAWIPAGRALYDAHANPSGSRAFHAELVRALEPLARPGDRVEIAFTLTHWEAAYVAPDIPIARGWERQVDRKVNAPLYDASLDGARYARWLRSARVRFVALPAAPLDPSATREAALLRAGVPGLRELPRAGHWRIWEATQVPASPERAHSPVSFALDAARAGDIATPERWTHFWRVASGAATLHRDSDGFTVVGARRPGRVVVRTRGLGG